MNIKVFVLNYLSYQYMVKYKIPLTYDYNIKIINGLYLFSFQNSK